MNLIVIHILGDAFSPPLMGYISDRSSLPSAFIAAVVATALSAAVLFYGMRYASAPPRGRGRNLMHIFWWVLGVALAAVWVDRVQDAARGMRRVADITRPEWDRLPTNPCRA